MRVSLKLFQEKGYEATTIQDIVDALGMSKGSRGGRQFSWFFRAYPEIRRAQIVPSDFSPDKAVFLAVVGNSADYCWPCGACRQMLYEFAPNLTLLVARKDREFVELPGLGWSWSFPPAK